MSSADKERKKKLLAESDLFAEDVNWVDGDTVSDPGSETQSVPLDLERSPSKLGSSPETIGSSRYLRTLVLTETAFLASTASLIWTINYYFPLGPLLKIFFPVPIALVYLRRGKRASSMAAIVASLLLSVLMGPTRSIIFLIPYGLMGVQLGFFWRRGASWYWSIFIGAIIGSGGLFFRFWLLSILLGEDLWVYIVTGVTELIDWIFIKLGLLAVPNFLMIQFFLLAIIFLQNLVYLFAVHLVSLLLLDRLGNPIPRPPQWVRVLLDYE